MWTRSAANKITGMIKVTVWTADNVLFFEGEFDTIQEAERAGEAKNREALTLIMGGYKLTEADWNDPLLDMTDDEILSELLK